ncbi:PAS domain S-box protein [Maribellus maritimus]|uniref:PAS domain S-box protein n=1 Tax=Maribellus maritimus TaxID=2870838 RepID=UPI001EEB2E28|nr:PAS domain S-box protein [Maribellus maritimus]MCG6188117.1 PAS domain S-box protein [Maribellus maritimus]
MIDWAEGFNGAITVCDLEGVIVYMNEYSVKQFHKYGGEQLLGSNLLDCHPEPAKSKLKEMLKNPADNMYTTEKNGVRKIIYQTPWKENDRVKGIVEISFQLGPQMPNFGR